MFSRERAIIGVAAKHLVAALPAAGFGIARPAVRRRAWARALRRSAEDLGPAFIKLGQLVSVRPDEFSAEFVAEMRTLQSRVPPTSTEVVRDIVRRELGRTPDELWDAFEDAPVASASVAQVHRARLRSAYLPAWGPPIPAGAPVAVKVLRPGAEHVVAADVRVMRRLAERLERMRLGRRLRALSLVEEFAASMARELDLRLEGRAADRFGFDFRDDPQVVVPRVVWSASGARVLTMEFMDGWHLNELDEARAAGVDCRALAIHGATAFMRQVFVWGRYHADLHPANLLVTPQGTIAYLDFGIVGTLTPDQRREMAQVMAALVYRDAGRALRHSAALGVQVPPERVEALTAEIRALLESARRADGTQDLSAFGLGFLRALARHDVLVPQGYGMLVKSLVTVEGVARALYPEIDIIETARPFVTRLLASVFADPAVLQARLPAALRAAVWELTA